METASTVFQHIQPWIKPLRSEERLALIRAIATMEPAAEDKTLDAWEQEQHQQLLKEERAWYSVAPETRARYRNEFVAVLNGEVVDHDADRRALYLRVRQQFGPTSVLIVPSECTEPPTYTIHSPRIERDQ